MASDSPTDAQSDSTETTSKPLPSIPPREEFDLTGLHIVICIPSHDAKIVLNAAATLVQIGTLAHRYGFRISILVQSGMSLITSARNYLVEKFINDTDGTHLFFLDNDISFDKDAFLRLVSWGTICPVVAGCYRLKQPRHSYRVDLIKDEEDNYATAMGGQLLLAERVPTGFMLIQRKVIEDLSERHPEFHYRAKGHGVNEYTALVALFQNPFKDGAMIGEDYFFCDLVTSNGYAIFVDPAIELGHIGLMEYHGALIEAFDGSDNDGDERNSDS